MAQLLKYGEALNQSRVSKMEIKTIFSDVPVTVNLMLASSVCACVAACISHSNQKMYVLVMWILKLFLKLLFLLQHHTYLMSWI